MGTGHTWVGQLHCRTGATAKHGALCIQLQFDAIERTRAGDRDQLNLSLCTLASIGHAVIIRDAGRGFISDTIRFIINAATKARGRL